MRINLGNEFGEFDFFAIEDAQQAETLADKTNGVVYSWKTESRYNWLQKGFSVVDVLGLTILPKGLPDWIDLPDDVVEHESLQTKF
jgi:hypothetical protein